MIVLDASVVAELLLRLPAADKIKKRIAGEMYQLNAPELIDVEVLQVLRRLLIDKTVTAERAEQAHFDLIDMPVERYPHLPLLIRMWELRDNVSAYDAAYIALAEILDCPLLTLDKRLAAAPGVGANIELV